MAAFGPYAQIWPWQCSRYYYDILVLLDKLITCSVNFQLCIDFCSSHYGCKVWTWQYPTIDDCCVVWQTVLDHVWYLPQNSPCRLIPLSAAYFFVTSLSVHIVLSCLSINSHLISWIVHHSIFTAMYSVIRWNIFHCANTFGFHLRIYTCGPVLHLSVSRYNLSQLASVDLDCAGLTLELILVHDGYYKLNQVAGHQ